MQTNSSVEAFRRLHDTGCFVVPNPWDRGSTIALASMGFRALATTSAGLAYALGRRDSPTTLDRETVLANVREIVGATALPVSADFQAGYGATPDDVAQSVGLCVATGVAGLSIEDASGQAGSPLFEHDVAVDRVRAARAAIDESGVGVVLTARAEAFFTDDPRPLDTVIERLVAFAEAGADCLFAPGISTPDQISAVVEAVAPKPVNVLLMDPSWMTVDSLEALGVRRISVGSALSRVAWGAFLSAAGEISSAGTFGGLEGAEPFGSFNELFRAARD